MTPSTPLPEQGMNPINSEDELRKKIIGELSRVQLYAKDHPYDVTSGDEHDIEFAADNIMELISNLQRQHERRG